MSCNATIDVLGGRFIPEALYSCKHCAEEFSWPAQDLYWSHQQKAWVCNFCWDSHEDGEFSDTLAEFIKLVTPGPVEVEERLIAASPDMLQLIKDAMPEMSLRYYNRALEIVEKVEGEA